MSVCSCVLLWAQSQSGSLLRMMPKWNTARLRRKRIALTSSSVQLHVCCVREPPTLHLRNLFNSYKCRLVVVNILELPFSLHVILAPLVFCTAPALAAEHTPAVKCGRLIAYVWFFSPSLSASVSICSLPVAVMMGMLAVGEWNELSEAHDNGLILPIFFHL